MSGGRPAAEGLDVRFMRSLPAFLVSGFLTMLSTLSISMLVEGVAKSRKKPGNRVDESCVLGLSMPNPMLPILVLLGVTVICAGVAIRFSAEKACEYIIQI